MGCTPFEKHFNRVANTRWKNRMSNIDHLDKRKAIMSKERATNWELHDGAKLHDGAGKKKSSNGR